MLAEEYVLYTEHPVVYNCTIC